jgi:host factor-I protein
MGEEKLDLQDKFLNEIKGKKATVYLVNGIKLSGELGSCDRYCITLRYNGNLQQLIYKHAISTICITTDNSKEKPAG